MKPRIFGSLTTLHCIESSNYITGKNSTMPKQNQNNSLQKVLRKGRMTNKRKHLLEEGKKVQKEKDKLHKREQRSKLSKDQEEEERKRNKKGCKNISLVYHKMK